MITTRKLSTALNAELSPVGFTRLGSTWHLRKDDVIAVLNLQKSNYDATYFLNVGFWLRQIEDVEKPKIELCHVRTRAEALWPAGSPSVTELLCADTSCDDDAEQIAAIRLFVRDKVVPLLLKGSTVPGVLALLEEHEGFAVLRVAWALLGIDEQ